MICDALIVLSMLLSEERFSERGRGRRKCAAAETRGKMEHACPDEATSPFRGDIRAQNEVLSSSYLPASSHLSTSNMRSSILFALALLPATFALPRDNCRNQDKEGHGHHEVAITKPFSNTTLYIPAIAVGDSQFAQPECWGIQVSSCILKNLKRPLADISVSPYSPTTPPEPTLRSPAP